MPADRRNRRQLLRAGAGFTVLELVTSLILVSLLSAVVLPRFLAVSDAAHDAVVDGVYGALVAGHASLALPWYLAGMPGAGSTALQNVQVGTIVVRYRNGQPQTTTNSNHIPVGTPNRATAQARLFFLFLDPVPAPIIATTSTDTGWVMLGTNAACAPVAQVGANPRYCWEYRVKGIRHARISYSVTAGRFFVD